MRRAMNLGAWLMNNVLRSLAGCFACVLGLTGPVVHADSNELLRYVSGHAAVVFTDDHPWSSLSDNPRAELRASMPVDTGWGAGASVGKQFGNWRVEGELFWREAETDGFVVHSFRRYRRDGTPQDGTGPFREFLETGSPTGGPALTTQVRTNYLSAFVNGFYDVPTPWAWAPYIGVGVGVVRRTMSKHVELDLPAFITVASDYISDEHESNWDFVYQLQAGVDVPLTDALSLDIGYRYKAFPNATIHFFEDGGQDVFALGLASPRVRVGASHSADIGLRWSF